MRLDQGRGEVFAQPGSNGPAAALEGGATAADRESAPARRGGQWIAERTVDTAAGGRGDRAADRRELPPRPRVARTAGPGLEPPNAGPARRGARPGEDRYLEAGDLAGSKKGAQARRAWIVFEDESGFSLTPSVRRTWAPRGKTPVLLHRHGLNSHHSHTMRRYLETQRRWLWTERLPAYAPDLNPSEGLWSNLKGRELANRCDLEIADTITAAKSGTERVRGNQQLLFSFLAHTGLSL